MGNTVSYWIIGVGLFTVLFGGGWRAAAIGVALVLIGLFAGGYLPLPSGVCQ